MYEGVVQDLIDELGRLPGVGPKSAQRIAFHLLQAEEPDVRRLADVLIEVKARVRFCSTCFNVSEDELCRICSDPRRDVVELGEVRPEHLRQLARLQVVCSRIRPGQARVEQARLDSRHRDRNVEAEERVAAELDAGELT